MRNLLLTLVHLAVVAARLCGPGGVRAVIAENLLLTQQLIVLRRARRRAPNLTRSDRLLCGFESLFLNRGRIRKLAIALRPSTLLAFHQALVRRKYRLLFSSRPCRAGFTDILHFFARVLAIEASGATIGHQPWSLDKVLASTRATWVPVSPGLVSGSTIQRSGFLVDNLSKERDRCPRLRLSWPEEKLRGALRPIDPAR
jgi:hypothetical protein